MKRTIICLAILLALGAFGAQAAEPDYDAIADNIVNQSLKIQPGEADYLLTAFKAQRICQGGKN